MAERKYLDSEKVIKLLRKDLICKVPPSFSYDLFVAADEIAKMDGEDVRPVKRGKWLAAGRLVLQPKNHSDASTFWSMIMPPEYKPDNALLVVSALCDCCRCWHVAVRDAGSAIDDYHTEYIPLPWFCPTCGADMRPEEHDEAADEA